MKQWIARHPEIKGLLWAIFAVSQGISLLTFKATSSSHNWLGLCGHVVGWFWYFCFGLSAFFILSGILYHAWRLIMASTQLPNKGHFAALFIAGASISLLFTLVGTSHPRIETFVAKVLGFSQNQFRLGGLPFYGLFQQLPYINLERLLS